MQCSIFHQPKHIQRHHAPLVQDPRYGSCLHRFWHSCSSACFWHWIICIQNARLYILVCALNFTFHCFYYFTWRFLLDIRADNIIFGIADDSVFSDFEEKEIHSPCPRKELDGRIIYMSREFRMPRNWGAPVLCDFGSAMFGDRDHFEDIQPDIYRAPEVILEVPWTYSADVWNVGCMVRQTIR